MTPTARKTTTPVAPTLQKAVTTPPPPAPTLPAAAKAVATALKDTFVAARGASAAKPAVALTVPAAGTGPQLPPGLTAAQQKTVTDAASGALGPVARSQYEALTGSAGYKALSPEVQGRVLASYAQAPNAPIATGQLQGLVGTAGFTGLSAAQQRQALDVFDASDVAGRGHLHALSSRTVNGRPALLDPDANGRPLVDSLHGIATGAIDPRFAQNGVTREALLGSIMQEASSPGQINQSNRGTCTVTSMQYMLCDTNPGEYVRLMQGLVGPAGTVRMRNGDTLTRVGDSIAPDSASDRSASERVFQSAMMDYSNGSERYSNVTDKSTEKILLWTATGSGLDAGEQERGLQALFGRGFDHYTGSWNFRDDGADILDRVRGRSPTDTYVRMAWGDKKEGGHAVVVTRVENGRVYFRNPWGPTGDPAGTTYSNPPRQLENGAIREESMSEADFKRWVRGAMIPD